MRCLVCNNEYTGAECPFCKFPNVQINGDYDEGIKQLMPMINTHRQNFFGSFTVGLVLLRRINDNSGSPQATSQTVSFGQIKTLINSTKWLDQQIVAYPNSDHQIEMSIELDRLYEKTNLPVAIRGFSNPDIVNIGIQVTDEYSFKILARNMNQTIKGESDLIRL